MSDTEQIINEVVTEMKEGKIVNVKQLDKRLSQIGFMRVPLMDWREVKSDVLRYWDTKKELLEDKNKGFALFILGIVIGFCGSIFYEGKLNLVSLVVSLIGISLVLYFYYKNWRKIKGVKLIKKEFVPFILVVGNHKGREELIKRGWMKNHL